MTKRLALGIGLVILAGFFLALNDLVTNVEPIPVKETIQENVEKSDKTLYNAEDSLRELRDMRNDQQQLEEDLKKMKDLLEQYHRGTLKSA